jgi:tetratricopeptide (TPR) repeat protein
MIEKVASIQYKEEGNISFQNKDYLKALELYTKGISADRNNASLWGNRATTYFNLCF